MAQVVPVDLVDQVPEVWEVREDPADPAGGQEDSVDFPVDRPGQAVQAVREDVAVAEVAVVLQPADNLTQRRSLK